MNKIFFDEIDDYMILDGQEIYIAVSGIESKHLKRCNISAEWLIIQERSHTNALNDIAEELDEKHWEKREGSRKNGKLYLNARIIELIILKSKNPSYKKFSIINLIKHAHLLSRIEYKSLKISGLQAHDVSSESIIRDSVNLALGFECFVSKRIDKNDANQQIDLFFEDKENKIAIEIDEGLKNNENHVSDRMAKLNEYCSREKIKLFRVNLGYNQDLQRNPNYMEIVSSILSILRQNGIVEKTPIPKLVTRVDCL
jgi:hypothetical protein